MLNFVHVVTELYRVKRSDDGVLKSVKRSDDGVLKSASLMFSTFCIVFSCISIAVFQTPTSTAAMFLLGLDRDKSAFCLVRFKHGYRHHLYSEGRKKRSLCCGPLRRSYSVSWLK
jgi:hypothetical protein